MYIYLTKWESNEKSLDYVILKIVKNNVYFDKCSLLKMIPSHSSKKIQIACPLIVWSMFSEDLKNEMMYVKNLSQYIPSDSQ